MFEPENEEQRPLLNSVKSLEITDRDLIWTLSTKCVKIITDKLFGLECLNISGRKMVPIDSLAPFFNGLKVSNLLRFQLGGIADDVPMWFYRKYQIENLHILQKSIREFFKRCEKLESFTLRLSPPGISRSQFFIEDDSEFKFPATLREIDIDQTFSRPFINVDRIVPFRFGWFDNCRENLVKLRICNHKFDQNFMYFAAAGFANLKELVIL